MKQGIAKRKSFLPALAMFITALLGFTGIQAVSAQDIPPKPDPPRLVNDFAGILSNEEVRALESKLVKFNDSTSTEIVVVIVKSLNGQDKNAFAYEIGEKWGVGKKGKNNGAVVMIKPRYPGEKGEASIQTGYGLEGVIPDALAKRIITIDMIPHFQKDNYYAGIDAAVNTMISLAKKEFTADQYLKKHKKDNKPIAIIIPFIILGIVLLMIRSGRARGMSVGKSIPFWTAFWLLGSMGSGHSGSWNNFTGGGSGFGGFGGGGGGGGFGGFGGGSFGGGGAGGSW